MDGNDMAEANTSIFYWCYADGKQFIFDNKGTRKKSLVE